MVHVIAQTILRQPDEEKNFDFAFGAPVGAGLAKSREEIQSFMRILNDLDFRVTPVGENYVQIWVNGDRYKKMMDDIHSSDSKEDLMKLLYSLPVIIIKSALQGLMTSSFVAGVIWIVNQVTNKGIVIKPFFAWTFVAISIISFILLVIGFAFRKK